MLIDDIVRMRPSKYASEQVIESLAENHGELFDIQNVADYWHTHDGSKLLEAALSANGHDNGGILTLDAKAMRDTFINVTPPFDSFWTEVRCDREAERLFGIRRIGVAVRSFDLRAIRREMGDEAANDILAIYRDRIGEYTYDGWIAAAADMVRDADPTVPLDNCIPTIILLAAAMHDLIGARWASFFYYSIDWTKRGIVCQPMAHGMLIRENGTMLYETMMLLSMLFDSGLNLCQRGELQSAESAAFTVQELYDALKALCRQFGLYPTLMAICFMHCKNVGQQTVTPPPLLRQQRRHGIKPPLTYRVLTIDPMKQILKHEGDIEKSGIHRALHICRGNFANYTPDKPLFGRTVGMVWRPAHVRGSIDEGVADKDYRVLAKRGREK